MIRLNQELKMKSEFICQFTNPIVLFGLICCSFTASDSAAQDGLDRLFQRVGKIPTQASSAESCLVPNSIHEPTSVQPAIYKRLANLEVQLGDEPPVQTNKDFAQRSAVELDPRVFFPEPIGRSLLRKKTIQHKPRHRGEFVFDGDDAGRQVTVDQSWNVYGLDIEDTIGHFDTLDGRRLVTPSNRVAIYSPRFSAVRKVADLGESFASTGPRQFEDDRQTIITSGKDFSATTKQHEQLGAHKATNRASSLIDQTRGVIADNTTVLFGVRTSLAPFENLEIIRIGRFSSAEVARLDVGLQSASVWQDDLGLQVTVDSAQPIIVKDVNRVQEIESVESKDNAILRVVKIASKIAARPGEIVEFTIRFDNLSSKKIGNVTLMDNLTSRLEYVPDSAESSHHAKFITKPNEAGSLQLRWEIRDPLPKGKGGVVRFKCRVR